MNFDLNLIFALLMDGVFAAVAAAGFAAISNPPVRAILFSALLAALGHAFRFYIHKHLLVELIPATFCASLLIGLLGIIIARRSRHPIEVFVFPALLPMIPGIPAYQTVLSLFLFMDTQDVATKAHLLVEIFSHGLQTTFVLLALVVGACTPMLLLLMPLFRYNPAKGGETPPPSPPIGHVDLSAKAKAAQFGYNNFRQ